MPNSAEYEADTSPPKGAMLAIFLIVLADLLGFGLIIPLLPFYARQYAASDLQVGLLFSVYSFCQLIASPMLGLASDRLGRRPVLLFSQIGSVLGYLLLAFATYHHWTNLALGLTMVYISRAIDGLSGGNISTAQAYVSDVTTGANRAKGMGILGAAFGIGFSVGPAVGGILGGYHVWLPAVAAAMFSLFAVIQTWLRLPESRVHTPSDAEMWLHPSKFLPILRDSLLVQLLLISFFSMMAFVMMEAVFAIFLKDTFDFGPRTVGYFFGFVGVVIVIVQGGLIGRLTKAIGEWPLAIAGPLAVSLAMCLYARVVWAPFVPLVLVGSFFNASGRSLQTPTLSSLVSRYADPQQQGTVFGLFHSLSSLARAIGPAVATWVYMKHHSSPFFLAGTITLAVALWTIALRYTPSVQGRSMKHRVQPNEPTINPAPEPT